jgi:hypothetical protein
MKDGAVDDLPPSPFELSWNSGMILDDPVVRAQHQDDAEQSPRLILKRSHFHPCSEARTVLPDSPAVHLDCAAARKKEIVLGFACFAGRGRVEPGKVAAIPAAFSLACSGKPRPPDDATVGVEQVNDLSLARRNAALATHHGVSR